MAPFPDFGTWLLRSVRGGDANPDSPVSVIERLNALPRPLRNAADKDTLVGAVLTLGPSLQLALHILLELLPEDDDRERLGEVLCPTLGQLQRSLTDTLLSLRGSQDDKSKKSFAANRAKHMRGRSNTLPLPSEILFRGVRIDRSIKTPSAAPTLAQVPESPSSYPSPDAIEDTLTTNPSSPHLHQNHQVPRARPPPDSIPLPPRAPLPRSPSPTPSARRPDPAADLALVKELRAEMRVNAAIQVAVDSLEFAEGQLKIVKNVHRLHGGSFQLLEKHFYQGYNRILFRALELERREFDSPSGSDYCPSPRLVCDDMGDLMVEGKMKEEAAAVPQRSISFEEHARDEVVPVLQLEPPSPEKGGGPDAKTVASRPASPEKRMTVPAVGPGPELMRRNTAPGRTGQGARQAARTRPPAKRRLSLAEELALAGDSTTSEEDDESGEEDDDDDDDEPETTQAGPKLTDHNSDSDGDADSSSESPSDRDTAPRRTGPNGSGGSDSDESSSSDDDDEADERSTQSSIAPVPAPAPAPAPKLQAAIVKAVVTRGGTKRLQTALLVSSPPTSPERQADIIASAQKGS
ncbi:hypothetical protein B0T18DRAFT_432514 [Schizothecium vesticola]|uniref:Uncharacterized protein n=1 Tax=Schizothecium vesticola TaxID=314040 RepID=A0AA40EL79_9PEZI|nr:hypothetical protein B0T18DRAFT_432514 [Schizothecium vesticola]